MTARREPVTMPMMVNRKNSLLSALFVTVLAGIVGISVIPALEPIGRIPMSLALGQVLIAVAATWLRWGFTTVTVGDENIEFHIGTFVYRKYRVADIQTVAKLTDFVGRETIMKLVIQTKPADVLETIGEQSLRKKPFVSQELKFRENKPDWKDVCLDAGLRKTGGLWIEYTSQRQQLLQEMLPKAAHREAKPYTD